jgi:two-component system NtrC family response regulator
MQKSGATVLVVDDDPTSATYLSLALRQAGHTVQAAVGGLDGLRAIESSPPMLVLTDLQMPMLSGMDLLATIKRRWPQIAVVVVTVDDAAATVVRAIQGGALNYLVKPVTPNDLVCAVERALREARIDAPSAVERDTPEIIGTSRAASDLRGQVARAARSDANVVIAGATGTGKELVARAIHRLWRGGRRPLVAHNCALTPPDLFDSEFFGHRRGAFTGAERDRVGLLRQADGGTLFLDELECLTLANQAKLLRVLDDGEVRALGAEESRVVAIRVVAATNRAPGEMIASGVLREDLYYRLRGLQIDLPPLRSRLEDVPALAAAFAALRGREVARDAIDALRAYAWPGNVRQLRTAVLTACDCALPGEPIRARDLDLAAARPAPANRPLGATTLQAAERLLILRAIEDHSGSVSRAADSLGIHRSTLRRKLRQLELGPGDADPRDEPSSPSPR